VPLSAVDSIQPAIAHTKEQLFTRFRWGQWLRLALVGILAAELHVGGCNFGNFGQFIQRPKGQRDEFLAAPAFPHIDPARLAQFAGLIATIVLLAVILFFVFLYISSVFRFILFDSVVRRECSIGESWDRWHRVGRRFFLWQLVFVISAWLFFGLIIGVPLLLMGASRWIMDPSSHLAGMAGSLFLLLGLVLLCALVLAVIQVLAKDFLVPVMALEDVDFADGWSRLLAIMGAEPGNFAIYVLMKIVLAIAAAIVFGIAAIIPALVVVTPCVLIVLAAMAAGATWTVTTVSLAVILGLMALFILIYLTALVSVPGTIFFPAYALYFFAGRYPNLATLLNPVPAPPVAPTVVPPPLPEMSPPLPPSPEPIG